MLDADEQDIVNYLKSWPRQFVSGREIGRRAAGKRRYPRRPLLGEPTVGQAGRKEGSRSGWRRALSPDHRGEEVSPEKMDFAADQKDSRAERQRFRWNRRGGRRGGSSLKPTAYSRAGVDIALGNKVKSTLPRLLAATHRPGVLGKVGGFGGLFALDIRKYRQPVLVSSVDGVGTKLKLAFAMDPARYDWTGPGQSLCQRHRGAWGRAAFFPGLHRHRQA